MLVCVDMCLSVVSRAAWEGDTASVRPELIWAGQCLFCQSRQGLGRTELHTGPPGDGLLSFPSV